METAAWLAASSGRWRRFDSCRLRPDGGPAPGEQLGDSLRGEQALKGLELGVVPVSPAPVEVAWRDERMAGLDAWGATAPSLWQ